MLERLVTVCKVRQPMLIFSSVGLLDDTLKKGLYSLESARDVAPQEKENQKALIFEIKQILEAGRQTRRLRQLHHGPEGGSGADHSGREPRSSPAGWSPT